MEFALPYRFEHGLDALLGFELLELTEVLARGQLAVRDELKQPAGLVHGGVYACVAETLASVATGVAVAPEGRVAMGLSNQTSFLRPITTGTLHAEAVRKHRGRNTWVWEVEITDDQGRLCVLTRMTVAVRDTAGS
jgi:1,4-dihydroxy-2-naphthoyl-CoA hydrolase